MSTNPPKKAPLNHNFWVGGFTIMGLLLLAAVTLSLRNWDFLSNRTTYYARFSNVKRLDIGAKVLASGVAIGEVSELRSIDQGQYQVLVKLRIDDTVKLYRNARAFVSAAAVIGDTTINLLKGSGSNPLEPEGVIDGESQPEIEDIARNVSESISSVTSMLNDPETRQAIRRTLINLASATEKIDATFGMLNTELSPLMQDLRHTTQKIDAFMSEATSATQGMRGELKKARQDWSKTTQEWSDAAEDVSKQVDETANRMQAATAQLEATLSENEEPLRVSILQLKDATLLMRQIAEDLRKGEGTLGLLINDPRPFENLSKILEQLTRTLGGGAPPVFNYEEAAPPAPNAGAISPMGEPVRPAGTPRPPAGPAGRSAAP